MQLFVGTDFYIQILMSFCNVAVHEGPQLSKPDRDDRLLLAAKICWLFNIEEPRVHAHNVLVIKVAPKVLQHWLVP
jgi:hypothetical protein